MPINNSSQRFRWLIIGLIVSFLLNAFLVGFWLGNFSEPTLSRPGPVSINRFIQQLPEADQQLIQAAFKSRLPIFQNLRQELRQKSKQVALLMQEQSSDLTVDLEKLKQLLQQIRILNEKIQENFHQMIVELFPSLTLEGKRKLAESQRWDLSSILQRR